MIKKLETQVSSILQTPRMEGNNIMSWIGFKHVMYLAEEAVIEHFRSCGLGVRTLFEEHGLSLDLVASGARILHALHVDDVVRTEVHPQPFSERGISFEVKMFVDRKGDTLLAYRGDVLAVLRTDNTLELPVVAPPAALSNVVVPRATSPGRESEPSLPVVEHNQRGELLPDLLRGKRGIVWKNRIPYFYCHGNNRLRMSGYLRMVEEAEDLFLEHCDISINTMLETRRWIPVVPSAKVEIVGEAYMEEPLFIAYGLEEITKGYTYTCSMRAFAQRGKQLHHVASGEIVHGYAHIDSRKDWSLVRLTAEVEASLRGGHA
jgi:acyl-CoA thioesterase FadM